MKKAFTIIFLLIFLVGLVSADYYGNYYDNDDKVVYREIVKRYHRDGYYEKIIINNYKDRDVYYDYSEYKKSRYSKYSDYKYHRDSDYFDYYKHKSYHGISGTYMKFNQLTREYEPAKCYYSPPKNKVFYRKCP